MAGGKLISTGVEFPDATTQTTSGLPLTGGALTGAVTTTSTFDGRDVAADGVTADAALPKAGGTMTGTIAGFTSTGIDDNATSTAITIDASENVGIGITSPNERLSVVAEDDASPADNGFSIYRSVGDDKVTINCQGGAAKFIADGGSADMASIFYSYNGSTLSERMRIESTGDVEVSAGNLVIGTSGKGIDFSADGNAAGMTSEVLDDYETGTFTPVISDATSGGNLSPTSWTGKYTKIGRVVTINMPLFNVATTGMTGTNGLFIQGLPFTAASDANYHGSCMLDRINFTGFVMPTIQANKTYAYLNNMIDSGLEAILTVASVVSSGNTDIDISITYTAA